MKVITVLGARPQFIKASVVSHQLIAHHIDELIINTNQHFDYNMSELFFEQMQIPVPKYNLNINNLSHGAMTGRMLEEIEKILIIEKPDWVLVYGDTNSTLAGALAASKLHIKIAHVEAGLRSFNMQMPEEINRILTDRVSNILFCPTTNAISNLGQEGYSAKQCNIQLVGDVMYDSFIAFSQKMIKPDINIQPNSFILATIHRAENTDNLTYLTNILDYLEQVNEYISVVIPIHPRTAKIIKQHNIRAKLLLVEPVGYLEMLWLINNSKAVITDSGGLQKEAYFARKKCITIRSETEWVELVEHGYNKLLNPSQTHVFMMSDLDMPDKYVALYGDGQAAKQIVSIINEYNTI